MDIRFDNIGFLQMIDEGSFGEVYKAILKSTAEVIAVKKIKNNTEDVKVRNEIKNLKELQHKNIVKLYGDCKDHNKATYIILEYADCGSLYNVLHKSKQKLSADITLSWMLQLAEGMEYLHSKKTIHRDLKTKNLLLFNSCRTLKICDFGCVKQITTTNTQFVGTIYYMAPEVSDKNGKYTEKCDVFSFGIVLWEVLARKTPFYDCKDISPYAMQRRICKGERPNIADIKNHLDTYLKPIIKICWELKPERRPSMSRLVYIINNCKKNLSQ